MVRIHVKKRNTSAVFEKAIKLAVSTVFNRNISIRIAAHSYNIKKSTLHDQISKHNKKVWLRFWNGKWSIKIGCYITIRNSESFFHKGEIWIGDLPQSMFKNEFCLTRFSHSQAGIWICIKISEKVSTNEMPAVDWMRYFMNRHPRHALRKPENTSVARASAFNKHNVNIDFNKYEELQTKYSFEPSRIWNTDETAFLP